MVKYNLGFDKLTRWVVFKKMCSSRVNVFFYIVFNITPEKRTKQSYYYCLVVTVKGIFLSGSCLFSLYTLCQFKNIGLHLTFAGIVPFLIFFDWLNILQTVASHGQIWRIYNLQTRVTNKAIQSFQCSVFYQICIHYTSASYYRTVVILCLLFCLSTLCIKNVISPL